MRSILGFVVLAAVMAAMVKAERQDRRLSMEEREKIMARLNRRSKEEPVCTPPSTPPENNKPVPPLPASLTTEVELTFKEEGKQKVIYGAEAYDRVLNMGILRYELREGIDLTRPFDKQKIVRYNLINNESLIITTNTACEDEGQGNCDPKKDCTAESMVGVRFEMNRLFGLGTALGRTGYYGVNGILRWLLELSYVYKGRAMCRGMLTDYYEICMKDDKTGNTALVTYYFSLPDWTVDGNKNQVPLAIEIVSTGKVPSFVTRKVNHRYDFYEFFSNIRPDPDRLEPPADVYCKRRKSILDPPKNRKFFSYASEAVTPITIRIPVGDGQTQELEFTIAFTHDGYYDWDSKIVTLDYIPWFIFGEEYRYEYETKEVQEFNQGLTYSIYKHLERCHVRPIENITSDGDVVVNNNGTVSLLPPWMFTDLDGPWQYNGIHAIRGVDADVWVGQKNLLGFMLHENYVTYYASPFVIDEPIFKAETHSDENTTKSGTRHEGVRRPGTSQTKYKSLDRVPLRLERYLNIVAGMPHLQNNIYDFQTQPPFTHSIDISSCYPQDAKKRHFLLELPPDTLKRVKNLEDNLLHATQMALSEIAVISPLRINKAMLDVRDGKTFVLFTILPLPDVIGDSPGAMEENGLEVAANILTSAVREQRLVIIVHFPGFNASIEPIYVVLQPRSIAEVSRNADNTYTITKDKGYGSGDMAGLAFGVLILGLLVGGVVCTVIQQQAGKSSGLPRVTMARKSLSPSSTISFNSDMTASDI